jgi:uncharacterized membrane protein (UPF0127 family)
MLKMTTTALLSALLTAASCEKTDPGKARPEPVQVPVPPTEPAPVVAPTASRSVSASEVPAPCVFPLPAQPPPKTQNAASCPKDPQGNYALPHGKVTFVDTPGTPEVDVELARKPEHRERGLMYRTSMSSDAGMLFTWEDEAERVFWMKNTCLTLDMLFLSKEGIIVGVVEHVPTLNEAPRTVPCKATHVLEVNAGWTRAHGVRPGQRVQIDS